MRETLIDTSPIVAIFSSKDHYHEICVKTLQELKPPLITTWSVVTEALWLLRSNPAAIQKLLGSFSAGLFHLEPLPASALTWIASFLKKYESLNAQLADATLCFMAETRQTTSIFTLDRRDFLVYRYGAENRPYTLLPAI